jgi:hypothetical protein
MKKLSILILALTSIIFTSCEKDERNINNESKEEIKKEIINNTEAENIEVLEIESKIEEPKERVKSKKEIDYPERFNPTT